LVTCRPQPKSPPNPTRVGERREKSAVKFVAGLVLCALSSLLCAPTARAADRDTEAVAEAERALLTAVQRYEQISPASADLATSLRNLGVFYQTQGRMKDAEKELERALAMRKHLLGAAHADYLQNLEDLGLVYVAEGHFAAARRVYTVVLRTLESQPGGPSLRTASAINNLALLYANRGSVRKAISLYERELALLEASYGANSPRLVSTLERIAGLFAKTSDVGSAEASYVRAIRISEADAAPASKRRLLSALEGYAQLLARLPGRDADARSAGERAASLRAQPLGADRRVEE
jgi:tetratricopeptide (TPR) repeat protein